MSNNVSLENHKWYLIEIEGDRDIRLLGDKEPYLELDLESSKAGGNASCNNFFTTYTVDGSSITFGNAATTMMACEDDTNQEYRFLQALARIDSFEIRDGMLYLFEGDTAILIFESR